MEGQYIVKNLVLVASGIVLGGTVRGGYLVPEPIQTATVPTGNLELSQMVEI